MKDNRYYDHKLPNDVKQKDFPKVGYENERRYWDNQPALDAQAEEYHRDLKKNQKGSK